MNVSRAWVERALTASIQSYLDCDSWLCDCCVFRLCGLGLPLVVKVRCVYVVALFFQAEDGIRDRDG